MIGMLSKAVTSPYNRTIGYEYNQYTGNLSRITRPNNTYTNYDFDNLDRLESYMTHMPSGDFYYVYEHDDSNLISKITLPDGKYYEYAYDDLYRLTNEYALNSDTSPIYTNSYEYDLADNRTGAANGTADIYVLNALNQITEIYEIYQPPHATFTYDFNGNLKTQTTSAGTVSLDYDYENRLSKITYPVGGWTEFVYDALGRRLKTIEKNGQGQTTGETRYVYDGLNVIAELTGTDTLAAFFTHGVGVDDPLIMRYSGADYFYQKNHQNSVIEVDNISGGVVKKYKYDAFGNIKQETGPTVNRGFTYTSRERHARSGLYYYRARWYSPQLGRFLTPDPIGHLGGMNLYAYVGNAPAVLIDPFGLAPLPQSTIAELAPYFSDINLNLIDIHPDGIPFYVPGGTAGYTGKDYNIYFAPGQYDASSPEGIALIGHELVHIQQRQNNLPILFEIMYLGTEAYAILNPNTPYGLFEAPAYDIQKAIWRDLIWKNLKEALEKAKVKKNA